MRRSRTAERSTGSDTALVARPERGKRAEEAVVELLFARGFEIIGRNVRVGALELDVVARKEELAVIVEVRTRGPGSFVGALASIDAKKRASLLRGAERYWRTTLAKMPGVARVRLDVAAVAFDAGETRIEYVEAALTG